MSVRSELRAAALDRDRGCVWPGCAPHLSELHRYGVAPNPATGLLGARLEMAHLQQSSQGGPDTLDNVVMLCKFHHDVLDNRVVKGRRQAIVQLLQSYLHQGRNHG